MFPNFLTITIVQNSYLTITHNNAYALSLGSIRMHKFCIIQISMLVVFYVIKIINMCIIFVLWTFYINKTYKMDTDMKESGTKK